MMREKKIWAVLSAFLTCFFLCACGRNRDDALVLIGQGSSLEMLGGGMESSSPAGSADDGGQREEAADNVRKETLDGDFGAEPESGCKIYVHVCGAVEKPGVYALEEGSRAEDALLAAGGFTQDADREYVNLARTVADGEKLYFPDQEEARGMPPMEEPDSGADGGGLVNINKADQTELCTLPGIGASRAGDIIAYRESHGAFRTCEDIMKVSGIKNSVYDKIKDLITVKE